MHLNLPVSNSSKRHRYDKYIDVEALYVCFLTGEGTMEAVIKSSLTMILSVPKYAEYAGKKKEKKWNMSLNKFFIKIEALFFLQCEQKN